VHHAAQAAPDHGDAGSMQLLVLLRARPGPRAEAAAAHNIAARRPAAPALLMLFVRPPSRVSAA
jgi:hypothetical protein